MKDAAAARGAALLRQASVAALATVHDAAPGISMVPYAWVAEPLAFVVHVSALAAHTRDMRASPPVALLVIDGGDQAAPAHARARIAVQGIAAPCQPADSMYPAARAAYTARFPDMAGLFDLGDFSLYLIRPTAIRVVSGFAQAASILPSSLARALL